MTEITKIGLNILNEMNIKYKLPEPFSVKKLSKSLNLTKYRVRKELKIMIENGFVKKEKFYISNEYHLLSWFWVITEKGENLIKN